MDIRTLSYFLEVAKVGNISKAADNLHMSQPPLSRSIQLLEEELGVQLLIRGKRQVTLTPEGQFLKKRAEQMITLADKTVEQISGISGKISGKIYIGSIESLSVGKMPEWIVNFHNKYPDVTFNWWSGNSNDVLERLEHGLVDFAVVRTPCSNEKFVSKSLYKEPWSAYIPNDLVQKMPNVIDFKNGRIPMACLEDIPLIVPSIRTRSQEIREWFAKIDIVPNICCEISPAMNALSLVDSGMGVAILPKSAAHAAKGMNISVFDITEPAKESEIILVYNKDARLSAAANRFIEEMRTLP
jgi:DNA-binding transcriptional LysR family regulator